MRTTTLIVLTAMVLGAPGRAAPPPAGVEIVEGYADLAGLTLAAPIVVRATIAKAEKLGRKDAPDVPAGQVRMLIAAKVDSAIVAPAAVAPEIGYLWQGPAAGGRAPKFKKAPVLLFLRGVPGREDQMRLVSAHAQIAATPAAEAKVRAIIADSRRPELAGLRITGVSSLFRVPGSVPGEAETQIFFASANGRPVSAVVLSRPGQPRTYSVATGDVIDEAARPVPRDTLLWYRLACALPAAAPDGALAGVADDQRVAAADDYRFVIASLGACGRTLN